MISKTVKTTQKYLYQNLSLGYGKLLTLKEKKRLDLNKTAESLNGYVNEGFSTFDLADHYGSSEIIAGICKNNHSDRDSIKLFTKWVPKPGPINKEAVYKAIKIFLKE